MAFKTGAVTVELQSKIRDFISNINRARQAMSAFARSVGNSMRGATLAGLAFARTIGTQVVNSLRTVINYAKTLGIVLAGAFTALSTQGLRVAGQLETAEIGLTTLLGSAEEAGATVERIKKEAARTPFEITGLSKAVQLMSSVTKDGDKSIDLILDIGEGLAAMGKGQAELDRISVNLQQIAALGRASTLDIKQFAFAGIPIYEMLAETTGKSGEALDDLIQSGGVTFDVISKMFDEANNEGGRFFEAYKNQSGSFEQLTSNMKDSINIFLAEFVKETGLFEMAKDGMTGFVNLIENNKDKIIEFGKGVIGFFSGVRKALIDFATSEGVDLVRRILQIVIEKWIELYNTVMNSQVFDTLNQGFQAFSDIVDQYLMPSLSRLWDALGNLFREIKEFYLENKESFDATAKAIGAGIGLIIVGIIEVITWIVNLTTAFFDFSSKVVTKFREFTEWVTDLWNKFTAFLSLDTETQFQLIAYYIGVGLGIAVQKIIEFKNMAKAKFKEFVSDAVYSFLRVFLEGREKMNNLKRTVEDIFNRFSFIDLYRIGQSIIDGFIRGLASKALELYFKVQQLSQMVKDGFADSFKIQSPSKVTQEMGEMIGEGLKVGIDNSRQRVMNSASRLSGGAVASSAYSTFNNNFSISGSNNPEALAHKVARILSRQNNLARNGINL